MPGQRLACSPEPAMRSDIQRHRLAYGKGTTMRPHRCHAVAALVLLGAVTAALGQQQINSSQMATSLAGVSNTRLSLTGAQMRQAVVDNIHKYPGTLPPRPLRFPQMGHTGEFVVGVELAFH